MLGHKLLATYTHLARIGVIVELASETSIPHSDPGFHEFSEQLAQQIAAENPADVPALLEQAWLRDPGLTVGEVLLQQRQQFSENILISRFVRWDSSEPFEGPVEPPPRRPAGWMRLVK